MSSRSEITYNTLVRGFICNSEVTQALQLIDVITAKRFLGDGDIFALAEGDKQ